MIAIDTNILVRFLTRDDKTQYAKARKIFSNESVYIPITVLLETEWVLRFSYGFQPDTVSSSFKKLLGLPDVHITDPDLVHKAIEWHENGLDFADALHLSLSHNCKQFATFDNKFIQKAKGLTSCKVGLRCLA